MSDGTCSFIYIFNFLCAWYVHWLTSIFNSNSPSGQCPSIFTSYGTSFTQASKLAAIWTLQSSPVCRSPGVRILHSLIAVSMSSCFPGPEGGASQQILSCSPFVCRSSGPSGSDCIAGGTRDCLTYCWQSCRTVKILGLRFILWALQCSYYCTCRPLGWGQHIFCWDLYFWL